MYKWDFNAKNLTKYKKLDYVPSAIDIMSNIEGKMAIGTENGIILIMTPECLSLDATLNTSREKVTILRFSHSNDLLAAGFNNGDIHILSVPKKYMILCNIKSRFKSAVRS